MSFKPSYYPYDSSWKIPDKDQCFRYWQEFNLPEHIREHSRLVAIIAQEICLLSKSWLNVPIEAVVASALLHDLGKLYCIEHGGYHHQLGASLVMEISGNPAIAQGVMHHVYWPGEVDVEKFFLPLVLIYSDKRVMHDRIVSLEARFEDLFARYGTNHRMKGLIQRSLDQALTIQDQLNQKTGIDLNACTFNSRRMV
ncbi:HD domain-containing protein [Desulfonatronovibrio hydrogenovorans]|uniref:HD domain-containing protein n=1 Tax=Desulfonatronovibrio hydrogenovorans TaxID=53245 RepID=UPI00054F4D0E|nr:HD domain-containing protein [Desulfonatronovibrio hydrogenovorans]